MEAAPRRGAASAAFRPPPASPTPVPMDPHPARSFVLRLWLERSEGAAEEWRGEVKPVPAGESAYFRTLEALPALLARLLGRGERRSEP